MSTTCTRCGKVIAATASDPVIAVSSPSGLYHFECARVVWRAAAMTTEERREKARQGRSEAAKARWASKKGAPKMPVHKLLGDGDIAASSLQQMKERGGKWAAYQNVAMDSSGLGHLQFLKYGDGCTFEEPPEKYPTDTEYGMGWRYLLVGSVDLESGEIKPEV